MDRCLAEQEKYEKVWDHEAYRNYAPGELMVEKFLEICKPKVGDTLIDFGAGTGRGAFMLRKEGLCVQMVDIASNCLDTDVRNVMGSDLHVGNLWEPLHMEAEYGYCTDVMEHIPPEYVDRVLTNIFGCCDKVFFHICFKDDHFGKELGEALHLTVQPFTWWRDKLKEYGTLINGRDLIYNGIFYLTRT